MMDTTQLSETKRKLLDKYIRGNGAEALAVQQRIPRRPAGEPVPLSFPQQQVWVHSHMAGDIPIYNEAITVERRGPLDAVVLERCLTEIIRRHEIWRTTFETINGKPVQVVQAPSDRLPLKTIDLRHLPQSDRVTEALCLAAEDARRPFDLKKGPLLRATLARMDEQEYRLYMTFHQIIFDAVSAYRVLLPELTTLYEAFSAGRPSPLPEPTLQYGDFAYWQQKSLAAGMWSEQLSFWRKNLSGELPLLQWSSDHARPVYQTHRGTIQRFEFDSSLIAPLKDFCRREGVSSFMTFLASYSALLRRYTGQQDIVIGGLSAGRRRSELEALLGYFVNPLALRIDLSGNPTFRQLVGRARDAVLDALANDELPFENVVEALQLRPDPGRNPIFQFILSQQPQMPTVAPGWNLVTEEVSNGGSKLDMTIVVDERPDAISGPITYNPDLLDDSTVTRTVEHWQTLLAGALASPDRGIAELPLLTDSERRQILIDWNCTQVDYPKGICLHELFAAQVERTPDAVALKFEDKQMAYRELDAHSNQLARHLQSLGVGPDVPVGLYLERSFDMVVGLLGVLKAGGVCLPLDPTCPKDRVMFMLTETQAPVLLTTAKLESDLPRHSKRVVCLDMDARLRATEETAIASRTVGPENLAYIIYTSGSTGRPKGVQVTHRGLVNSTLARSSYYRDPVMSFLLLSSFAFDSSLAGIFWTLTTGGALVLPPDQSVWDFLEVVELVAQHRISHLLCVPSLYRQFLEEAKLEQFSSLRVAIVAGEECSKELVERHYHLLPEAVLFNEYGPTEATVWSSVYRCEPKLRSTRVPIGRPIANTQLYVLDARLQPVPVGIPGELHIAGAGVARGYLKRPDSNASSFIQNPFNGESGLYKTGDVVRYLPDGNLELLGRLDNQIKIRGFRIELEEIASVITEFEGIRQAVVAIREGACSTLVAYLVTSNPRFKIEDLRNFLRRKLPEVMIPSAFVQLKSLPLMINGKVDRHALPAPEQPVPTSVCVLPKDDVESRLLEIWQAILDKKPIGVTDNFFDLGGHSLMVVKLMLRTERAFGKRLSLRDVAQAPTIRQMAVILRGGVENTKSPAVIPIQPQGTKPPLFWVRGGPLFVPLARRLGFDQPFLGLHLPASEASRLPVPCKLEDVAAALVRRMREVQPEGPYYIAGLCVNGVIAYEMASQLTAQGQQVALLALFDAQNPEYYRDFSRESRSQLLLRKIEFHLADLRRLKTKELLAFTRERFLSVRRRLTVLRWQAHYALRLRIDQQQLENLDIIVHPSSYFYRPKRYSGRIAFFQSTDWPVGHYWDFHASWIDLVAGGLEVHHIPGGHESMFRQPNLDVLASRLETCLSEAQRSHLVVRVTTEREPDCVEVSDEPERVSPEPSKAGSPYLSQPGLP